MTKFAGNWGFGHIYSRNPLWKTSLFVQCNILCNGFPLRRKAKYTSLKVFKCSHETLHWRGPKNIHDFSNNNY